MGTFKDEMICKTSHCKTVDDWKAAYLELLDKADVFHEANYQLETAILQEYGKEELDRLLEIELPESLLMKTARQTMNMMYEYGYTKDDVAPISKESAMTMLENGFPVYLLFENNTKSKVQFLEEIDFHDGMFGVGREIFVSKNTEELADSIINIGFDR